MTVNGKWHGGKGSARRTGSNQQAYESNWDKIFGKAAALNKSQHVANDSDKKDK